MSRVFNNYVGSVVPKCPFCREPISNAEYLLNNFITSVENSECPICLEDDCEMISLLCNHEICCQCFILLMKTNSRDDSALTPIPVRASQQRPRSAPTTHRDRITRLSRAPAWEQRRETERRRERLRQLESGWRV
jgi:hypothetical protein